jgi:hypothetical protein
MERVISSPTAKKDIYLIEGFPARLENICEALKKGRPKNAIHKAAHALQAVAHGVRRGWEFHAACGKSS